MILLTYIISIDALRWILIDIIIVEMLSNYFLRKK